MTPAELHEKVRAAASIPEAMEAALVTLPFVPSLILGGGKAGRDMARAAAMRFPGVPGAVAVPHEHAGRTESVDLLGAGHPFPDAGSVAAVEAQETLARANPGPVLFLLSGGASALLGAPVRGLPLDEMVRRYQELLHSGLDITAMNAERQKLTRWGGGKLAAMLNRRVEVLVVSDVLGDRLEVIGSAPLWQNPPWPGVTHRIILSNVVVIQKLAASFPGQSVRVLPDQTGDVESVAATWANILKKGEPGIYLAGGEPTVKIPAGSTGEGGRNQHLVLQTGLFAGLGNWLFASIATDGVDGNSPQAGAWIDGLTAAGNKDSVRMTLAAFNSGRLCRELGIAFPGGPTGTNVADVQIGVVGPR